MVLIHGWPLSHESWSEQIPALKNAGYRVVTYDRRGFGAADAGDAYDALTGDLDSVLTDLDLTDTTLVGFSMGGGEVARYVATYGEDRLHSVVFAAAVPPYLLNTEANPEGHLTEEAANEMSEGLKTDRDAFFDDFTTTFFSAGDDLKVTEEQRQDAVRMCHQSDQEAALAATTSIGARMTEHSLILRRPAKSDWSGDEADIARPLAKRGRRQAPDAESLVGREHRQHRPRCRGTRQSGSEHLGPRFAASGRPAAN